MKQLFSLVALVAIFSMAISGLANAATANVTASVSVTYASVTLDNDTFSYGTVAASAASSTLSLWSGAGITATNHGSVSDLDIYGANTVSSSTGWTLATTNTGNSYIHKFCNDTDSDCTNPPAGYTALTTAAQILKHTIPFEGTAALQLQITTPATPTDVSVQSAVVVIQASAV